MSIKYGEVHTPEQETINKLIDIVKDLQNQINSINDRLNGEADLVTNH